MNVTLTFRWHQENIEEIVEWGIYYGTHSGGPYEKGPIVNSIGSVSIAGNDVEIEHSISVPDDSDTTYYFVVIALDNKGRKSTGSNEASFRFDLAPPAPPDNFEVVAVGQ